MAGYTGNNTDFHNVPNANVNGTVVVNNYANITAAAGYGIEAYNEGQGDVTVNDFAGTSISGAQFGIGTFSMSGGNVAVSMSTGDSITSGGIGIVALDEAASVSSSKTITVTAHGTINAASGIEAGYVLAGSAVIEPNVAGSVTVNSDATIVASGDYGIDAFNWGTGNVTVSAGTGSSITASNATGEGINAAAIDGGDVSVTNDGVLSARTGISAFASGAGNVSVVNNGQVTGFTGIDVTQNNPGATGSTTITNTDSVQGSGAAIAIAENATGAAEIDNTGTIGSSSLSFAIDESGGNLVINNNDHGVIDGSITAANTTFTNAQGATWNAGGVSEFGVASATGVVASTIDNSGTMNLASASISGASGLTITNETGGVIDGVSGSSFITGAAITNAGTIEATTGGTLTVDPAPLTNTGTLEAISGGTLKLSNIAVANTQGGDDGTVHTDGTSFLDLDGSSITGGNVTNAGTVYSTGLSAIDATITNTNSIEVGTGTLTLSGSISGTGGSATIDGGATLELNLADGQGVNFNGSGAELIIDGTAAHGQTAQSFTGDIHGLAATDEIDLRGISYGNPTYATYTYSPTIGVLSVNDGNGDHYDLDIGPGFAGAHFAGSDDTQGGTLITMNAADDAPAFAQTTLTASFSEQSNQTDVGTPDPVAPQMASGTLNFTDVDLTDLPTVSIVSGGQNVTWTSATGVDLSSSLSAPQKAALEQALSLTAESGNHNNGAVDWNYSIADSTLDFLGQGETLTITTTVALDDHQNLATLPTRVITVTIHGADDAPTITSATSDQITEAAGTGNTTTDHAGGTIGFADVDLSDRPVVTAPFSGYTYTDANGHALTLTAGQQSDLEAALTITPDANNANNGSATWSYGVVDSKLDFLAQGETLTLTYTRDGDGQPKRHRDAADHRHDPRHR